MLELGDRKKVVNADKLEHYENGELRRYPSLSDGFKLVADYDVFGLKRKLVVCDDMGDVEAVTSHVNAGHGTDLKWYTTDQPLYGELRIESF